MAMLFALGLLYSFTLRPVETASLVVVHKVQERSEVPLHQVNLPSPIKELHQNSIVKPSSSSHLSDQSDAIKTKRYPLVRFP